MKLLEFSGIDGSGKTTSLAFLAKYLTDKGLKVASIKEVGNQYIPEAVELRKLVLNPNSKLSNLTMESIFLGMAIENAEWIKANEDKYDYILCDRGFACKYAYGKAQTNNNPIMNQILNIHPNFRYSALSVYFRITPEQALERRISRGEAADRIEAQGQEYQRTVFNNYEEYFMKNSLKSHVIDASKSIEEVQSQLIELVDALEWDLKSGAW